MTRLSPEPSDAELVQRSLAGETRAFTQLVAKHQRLVFGVALSSARDPAQAEDVAQEAFVEAWRDLPRLREPARVGVWLAGIARNLARRWTRHTARRRTRESAAMPSLPEAVPTPLERTLDRETASLVHHALDELPAAYREALVLFYMQGQSVSQVATGLGITEDLAKQRLSRGRRALRASLETRIEGALTELGPSKSFTAMVMVVVGAATMRRASAAGKVFIAMKATKLIVVAVVLVIAAALVWHSWPATKATPAVTPAATPAATAPFASTPPSHQPPVDANKPAVHRFATPQMREQLVAAIRAAHQQRTERGPRPTLEAAADDPDNDYVRDAMTALLPAVLDCYHQARATHPALAGTLVVDFTIEGEPGVGGVVTASAIDRDQSEIQDPDLGQCVAEAMFALEIDPPLDGVSAKVSFPFTFRPEN